MQWLILASFCIFSCLANEVKNATAKGSYGSSPSYDEPSYAPPPPPPPSYDQGYGNPPPYGPYMAYQYMPPPPPPLVDRDVCDLDASVLLVVDSRRTHRDRHHPPGFPPMNRANRVRCSVVANYDEDSCNACCQHAARRDKSMPNVRPFYGTSTILGICLRRILAITDDFEDRRFDRGDRDRDDSDEDMDHLRVKRSQPTKVHHLKLREKEFEPLPYFSNVKCVCCAPKRPLPPPPPPPPIYQQPAQPFYGQPAASQPYGQPAASQPYGQPAASQPYGQPLASQPTYQQQPVASQPTYQQPAASQPTYQQQPAASPPSYQAAPSFRCTAAGAPPAQAPSNTEYPAPPAAQAPPQPVYQQAAPPAQNPIPNPY
ncbi:hypothetical protein OSTOST_12293 [Ostertagia ostertagi]